jgi:hypothetical protein
VPVAYEKSQNMPVGCPVSASEDETRNWRGGNIRNLNVVPGVIYKEYEYI